MTCKVFGGTLSLTQSISHCPLYSIDLNLLITEFWGKCRSRSQIKVNDVDELKQWLIDVWRGFEPSVINVAVDECACICVRGRHFEHFINVTPHNAYVLCIF